MVLLAHTYFDRPASNFTTLEYTHMFLSPCIKFKTICRGSPDEDAIVRFLCDENGFNEERIRKQVERLRKAKGKASQKRIDSFFSFKPSAIKKKKKDTKTKGKKRKGSSSSRLGKRKK